MPCSCSRPNVHSERVEEWVHCNKASDEMGKCDKYTQGPEALINPTPANHVNAGLLAQVARGHLFNRDLAQIYVNQQ